MKVPCGDSVVIYRTITPSVITGVFLYIYIFIYAVLRCNPYLIFPSLSEILKLLASCGMAPVNSSVKFLIVSAHTTNYGDKEKNMEDWGRERERVPLLSGN